uniref:CCHC-type domain-containing protein n=1 Tax=Photinus pyralis TaxID=7054 RepID=A0A1Y1KWH0_PHOPY
MPTDKAVEIRPKCAETLAPSSQNILDECPQTQLLKCGNPGHIRSKCPTCSTSGQASSLSSGMTFHMMNFCSLFPTGGEQERSMSPIRIRQICGLACLDTSLKTSTFKVP